MTQHNHTIAGSVTRIPGIRSIYAISLNDIPDNIYAMQYLIPDDLPLLPLTPRPIQFIDAGALTFGISEDGAKFTTFSFSTDHMPDIGRFSAYVVMTNDGDCFLIGYRNSFPPISSFSDQTSPVSEKSKTDVSVKWSGIPLKIRFPE